MRHHRLDGVIAHDLVLRETDAQEDVAEVIGDVLTEGFHDGKAAAGGCADEDAVERLLHADLGAHALVILGVHQARSSTGMAFTNSSKKPVPSKWRMKSSGIDCLGSGSPPARVLWKNS